MEKKNEQIVRQPYEAPHVEIITIASEQGFAASGGSDTSVHNDDIYIEDVEDGGIPWNTYMHD